MISFSLQESHCYWKDEDQQLHQEASLTATVKLDLFLKSFDTGRISFSHILLFQVKIMHTYLFEQTACDQVRSKQQQFLCRQFHQETGSPTGTIRTCRSRHIFQAVGAVSLILFVLNWSLNTQMSIQLLSQINLSKGQSLDCPLLPCLQYLIFIQLLYSQRVDKFSIAF